MRRSALAFALAAAFVFTAAPADAGILVHIDKSRQRMTVKIDGKVRHSWAISTGRRGYSTPSGTYYPHRLARRWFSRKYYNSPMPHSIFFHRGYAIHGSYEIRRLGGPASHGCVRLHPVHAAALFALVQRYGRGSTRIVISNGTRIAHASR
jgi:lipoprotein-anchoring transpeptidase ErfK/SrfK